MSKAPVFSQENLLLPNDLERRQIFHLLKKSSSYTAWKHVLEFWQKWADVTEKSVKESDERGLLPKTVYPPGYTSQPDEVVDFGETEILYEHYVDILKKLALVEEGVTRLGKGDKRVFTYDDANGFFARAELLLDYWFDLRDRIDSGDTVWEKETPFEDEFFEAAHQVQWVSGEFSRYIIEKRDLETPALFSYGLWEIVFLPRLPYPDVLPEAPEPEEDVVTKTGSPVACSGIWEPVVGATTEGLIFKKAVGPFTRVGPLNYLHAGTLAPSLEQVYRDPTDKEWGCDSMQAKVTWRLIWRDDRYEDGTIPEEEKEYRFVRPVQPGEEDFFDYPCFPWKYLRAHGLPHPLLENAAKPAAQSVPKRPPSVPGGKPCPKEGWWWTPAASNDSRRRYFKKDEIMLDFKSDYGMVIWQWSGPADDKSAEKDEVVLAGKNGCLLERDTSPSTSMDVMG
jgi:hypothetical protein